MVDSALPFFKKAPVIERVLGVQFDPLRGFTNAHLGAFWTLLDSKEWPSVVDAPSIPPRFETFPVYSIGPRLFMMAPTPFGTRIQIKNSAGNRVIQIQNGLINYNWLGSGHEGSYERFPSIREEFLQKVKLFRDFVSELGEWKPNHWEVTYVNHLPKGSVWESSADWNRVFSSSVSMPPILHKAKLQTFAGNWIYELESQRGRLHVELQHANSQVDQSINEILSLRLTARGPVVTDREGWQVVDGLELGHDAIVNGFKMISSAEARKYWEEQ